MHMSMMVKDSIVNTENKQEKTTFEDEPHVVANCIKKWFRESEEPICQYNLVKDFLNVGNKYK